MTKPKATFIDIVSEHKTAISASNLSFTAQIFCYNIELTLCRFLKRTKPYLTVGPVAKRCKIKQNCEVSSRRKSVATGSCIA